MSISRCTVNWATSAQYSARERWRSESIAVRSIWNRRSTSRAAASACGGRSRAICSTAARISAAWRAAWAESCARATTGRVASAAAASVETKSWNRMRLLLFEASEDRVDGGERGDGVPRYRDGQRARRLGASADQHGGHHRGGRERAERRPPQAAPGRTGEGPVGRDARPLQRVEPPATQRAGGQVRGRRLPLGALQLAIGQQQ